MSAVTEVRRAVRALLVRTGDVPLLLACSGGADSLALAAATTHVAARRGVAVSAAVVDHGLQPGSAAVAARTVEMLAGLGVPARVLPVSVTGPGGPEAAARRARYAALRSALPSPDALVLLGHTLDDQAETVLLGLGRGSGARSLAGMRPLARPWARPLLGVRRATTRAACAALRLPVWEDPHNADPAFTRVRLRTEVLPLLEDVLAGGVAEALARTAAQLAEDDTALDALACRLLGSASDGPELVVERLVDAPAALRRRVIRRWLLVREVGALTDGQLRGVDALVGNWRGQGGLALPGGFVVERRHGRLLLAPAAAQEL